jgi:hypothetical protein
MNSLLKTKAIRLVPEGMCKRCAGTGNGEEMADLGESFSHGAEFPIRQCNSCSGSGMSIAKTEITALGWTLLVAILAGIWASPPSMRLILILFSVSIALHEAALWRRPLSKEGNPTAGQIAPIAALPSSATEGVLSLNSAIESHRQTAVQVESQPVRGSQLAR